MAADPPTKPIIDNKLNVCENRVEIEIPSRVKPIVNNVQIRVIKPALIFLIAFLFKSVPLLLFPFVFGDTIIYNPVNCPILNY